MSAQISSSKQKHLAAICGVGIRMEAVGHYQRVSLIAHLRYRTKQSDGRLLLNLYKMSTHRCKRSYEATIHRRKGCYNLLQVMFYESSKGSSKAIAMSRFGVGGIRISICRVIRRQGDVTQATFLNLWDFIIHLNIIKYPNRFEVSI